MKVYNRDYCSMDKLRDYFRGYNWNAINLSIDAGCITVDDAFSDFLNVIRHAMDNELGIKTVNMRGSEPPYITPAVRVMLRQRNKL